MRSGKERIASIADSTVLIKIGIGVPRVRTGLRKCVAIVAMVKSLRRFTFILAFRAGMDRWMPRTVFGLCFILSGAVRSATDRIRPPKISG